MYIKRAGRYRQIKEVSRQDGYIYFDYSLNYCTYRGLCKEDEIINDLPINENYIKYRDKKELVRLQCMIMQRRKYHKQLLAQRKI